MVIYTGYNLHNNISSLYKDLSTEEGKIKSELAHLNLKIYECEDARDKFLGYSEEECLRYQHE